VSVEADPRACAALGRNIARNGLNQVALVEGAAGRCPGNATLTSYVPGSDELSNFGVMRVGMVPADVRRFDVETLALDEVLDALGVRRVHLLKMDVEGAEADALEGLHRRLSAALVDRIVLELHPALLAAQGRSVEAVLGPLHELGYRAWRIDHSPAAHRAAASGGLAMESLLLPLGPSDPLGEWPHVLLARADLEALPGRRGSTWAA
jgi:FkbM family methyltransferase